jgi:hypothetical protein
LIVVTRDRVPATGGSRSFLRAGDSVQIRQPQHAKSQSVHHLFRVRERVWVRHPGGACQLAAACSATDRHKYSAREAGRREPGPLESQKSNRLAGVLEELKLQH